MKKKNTKTEKHTRIPHYLVPNNPAFRALSKTEKVVWMYAASHENGFNNGRVDLAARTLADQIGCSYSVVARALQGLQDAGFLRLIKPGSFKPRIASEYRFTHLPCKVTGEPATMDFLDMPKRGKGRGPTCVAGETRRR